MRRLLGTVVLFSFYLISFSAHAILSMELTRGVIGAIPIAITSFSTDKSDQEMSKIIANDLKLSGRFKVYSGDKVTQDPHKLGDISKKYFTELGADQVVIGSVQKTEDEKYHIRFQLVDLLKGEGAQSVTLSKKFTAPKAAMRAVAHRISDLIFERLTGKKGVFSTKLAYVVVKRPNAQRERRFTLEIADADGYNPRPILKSFEPIMSPAWSPDGRRMAYVSFEGRRAGIFVHDIHSGKRKLLSVFPGINGAPAWSPDGKKIALVLSKSGSPNIYMIDVNTKKLTRLTNDFYINTEPAWSPDGRTLLFTSNRAGGPQIYKIDVHTKEVSRVTYDGRYNARPSFTHDGGSIAMIHKVKGIYKIGVLDLESGRTRVLTNAMGDVTSPSIAPNGDMILFDTFRNGRNMLGMVSKDGRVQVMLPARDGEAQDPAWSPFYL